MKTSRKDGILVFETLKPYKIAIDGNLEDRKEIILKDVNEGCENAAFDLEQMIMAASASIPQTGSIKADKKTVEKEDKETEDFFKNDSPSENLIEQQAFALESMISLSNGVKMSAIMEIFDDFISAGVVQCAGGIPMTSTIWKSVDRKDKKRIVFRYAAFFANPLESFLNMA